MNKPSSIKGFTLIELLVAMFILAVMGTAGFTMLSQINNSRVRIEAQSSRMTELQRTFYWLAEDMTQVIDRPIRSAVDSLEPGYVFNLQGESLFEFSRTGWSNPAADVSPARSTLQRVAYVLEDDRLLRQYWYHMDTLEETPTKRRQLLTGVDNLTLRFLDTRGEWQDSWPPLDTEEAPGMPRAVEFNLELNDMGSVTRVFALPG